MSLRSQAADLMARGGLTGRHKLVVAVSGGPDSLALLHLLARQGLHPAANMIVAHLNHQLRIAAAGEADFVAETAAAWGLACRLESIDVAGLARSAGLSLEEAGRQARYDFLARLAVEIGAAFVATGHNADDQAETVLMHFLRGTGLAGLRGMLPAAPLPGQPQLTLLRPLLAISRQEIVAYCQAQQLTPVEDETNTDSTFFRNRLRYQLLPELATYNPGIKERLGHLAETAAADYDLLQEQQRDAWTVVLLDQGSGWLRLNLAAWQSLPLALRRSTLRQAVWQLRPALRDVGFRTLELAGRVAEKGQVGAGATLPGEINLTVDYDSLWLTTTSAELPQPALPQLAGREPQPLPLPGSLELPGGWRLQAMAVTHVSLDAIAANRDPWLAYVALPGGTRLVVRPRQPGERLQPLGLAGQTSKIKEIMINRKIPAALRDRWPIVAGPEYPVWLVGYMIDERVRVGDDHSSDGHPGDGQQTIIKLTLDRL